MHRERLIGHSAKSVTLHPSRYVGLQQKGPPIPEIHSDTKSAVSIEMQVTIIAQLFRLQAHIEI